MNAAWRVDPESVVLDDGRVVLVGDAGIPIPGNQAEIFHPGSNTWTLSGPMVDGGRSAHAMGRLANGHVIVVGGIVCCQNGNQLFSTTATQIMDPATLTWRSAAAAPVGRNDFGFSMLPDGRWLATGGLSFPTNDNSDPLASADIYDPATNTWTAAPPMSRARWGHQQVTLADGRVMVMSGHSSNWDILWSTEFYDPATNQWTAGPEMHVSRRDFTATLLPDGRVLATGGAAYTMMGPGGGETAEIYTPATGSWTLVTSMSASRFEHTATLMHDGKVLVAGGANPGQTAEVFNPATLSWSSPSNMLSRRMFHAAAALNDGRVLVAGGWNQNPDWTNTALVFGDPLVTASAGPDQTIDACAACLVSVALDGSESVASPGRTITNYLWKQGADTLSSSAQPMLSGVILGLGTHEITLTITLDNGATDTDTVSISVIDAIGAKDALIAQLQGQLGQSQSNLATANATIVQLNGQVGSLSSQITSLNSQISTLTAQNGQLQTDLDAANAANGTLNGQVATLTTQNGQLQTDLSTANATIGTLNGQVSTLTAQNGQLQADLGAANATVASQAAQITGLQGQVSSLTTLNQQLSNELAIANQAVAACNANLSSLNQALTSSVTAFTAEFRTTFRDPGFVIPGTTSLTQVQNVFNVVIGLRKADQRPVYRGLGGNRND